MDDFAAVRPCNFRWDIFNPFVPWRRMVATFYHGSPTLTQWKVTLRPMSCYVTYWEFSFALLYEGFDEQDEFILAKSLKVNISINGSIIEEKRISDYFFWRANRHSYEFQVTAITRPRRDAPHHLVIEIEISIPNRNVRNQENAIFLDDLSALSEDMRRLFIHHYYFNMRLKSNDPFSNYPVHTCILRARWNKFFEIHPIDRMENATVVVNVSDHILREILIYVYSGALNTSGANWGTPSYMTELFQVMDRYNLYHLYKVFARDDSLHFRTTRKDVNINTTNFPLDGDSGQPLNDPSYMWRVNPDTDYEFIFVIQFFLSAHVPWFTYSLSSKSSRRIHAQVNLEYKRRFVGVRGPANLFDTVHVRNYTIPSNETEESLSCRFEGKTKDLYAFIAEGKGGGPIRRRRGIKNFIQCVLYLSDGTSVIQVRSEDNIELQNDLERFDVLSDHMHELLTRPIENDLVISCRAEWPSNHYFPDDLYSLHRSIFTTRVPEWRSVVLEHVPEGAEIPDQMSCFLSSELFGIILGFIYTGKLFPLPTHYLDEVQCFAERGGFTSLRNLVNRMRFADRST